MGYDVFISYSHQNKAIADAVCASLEQNGIRCWYAPRDINPSDSWAKSVYKAISSVRLMTIIVTDESILSDQVIREISCAVSAGVLILPFKLTKSDLSDEMRYYFSTVHWLDAAGKPLNSSITELNSRIRHNLGMADSPPAPPVKPQPRKSGYADPPPAPPAKPQPRKSGYANLPALPWENLDTLRAVGIYVGQDSLVLGSFSGSNLVVRTIPLSDKVLAAIPPRRRTGVLVSQALEYIRAHHKTSNLVCLVAVPYMSIDDCAQVRTAAEAMGFDNIRTIKCVSAAALSLFDRYPEDESDPVLVIEYNGASCEVGFVRTDSSVIEMVSVVQRRISPDSPMSFDLLRKDIYKAMDIAKIRKISHVAVSAMLPSSFIAPLENLFHMKCERMDPNSVVRGLVLNAMLLSGIRIDLLLLDIIDFDVCIGPDLLLPHCSMMPASGSREIVYNTARKDHCIDIILNKNNMMTDLPVSFRLSVLDVLDKNQSIRQKLKVACNLNEHFGLSFTITNTGSRKAITYTWKDIRALLPGRE